jgi:hypothetical protein
MTRVKNEAACALGGISLQGLIGGRRGPGKVAGK